MCSPCPFDSYQMSVARSLNLILGQGRGPRDKEGPRPWLESLQVSSLAFTLLPPASGPYLITAVMSTHHLKNGLEWLPSWRLCSRGRAASLRVPHSPCAPPATPGRMSLMGSVSAREGLLHPPSPLLASPLALQRCLPLSWSLLSGRGAELSGYRSPPALPYLVLPSSQDHREGEGFRESLTFLSEADHLLLLPATSPVLCVDERKGRRQTSV